MKLHRILDEYHLKFNEKLLTFDNLIRHIEFGKILGSKRWLMVVENMEILQCCQINYNNNEVRLIFVEGNSQISCPIKTYLKVNNWDSVM